MVKHGYQDRVIRHSLMWVNGIVKHNYIDGECVADFSCCVPALFTRDQQQRQRDHEKLVNELRLKWKS